MLKKIAFILFIAITYGQKLGQFEISVIQLESVLESAIRSEQKVFVEDFTGLQ